MKAAESAEKDGECGATLLLGDDYGDNACTIRCGRKLGHSGPHREHFEREGTSVLIEYYIDERALPLKVLP